MPNAATTRASSASEVSGRPIPLCYGYVWVTGKRHAYYQLQDTGNHDLDYTRVGCWLLGMGEWDGCVEMWLNDKLVWRGDVPDSDWQGWNWLRALDDPTRDFVFHFHPGVDATIGAGLTPVSTGGDQGVDLLWKIFPPAIQPLAFSRIAYYMIMRKQAIAEPTNTHQDDPTQWTDVNPIGLWRAIKCRLFDAQGNMTGYAFTTNPAWIWVDVRLRRKLMPEYNLSLAGGPDDLTDAVRAAFDWSKIYASAQYCDELLDNGRRRFTGNFAWTSKTSLQAIEEEIALCCRGFYSSYAGKYAINIDMPRSSVFTFTRDNVLPGSFEASEQQPHTAPTHIVAQFRDLLVPACNDIASITTTSNGRPTLTTTEPHPCAAGDWIAIGGTGTPYDGEWQVYSVPDIINPGTPTEVDPTTMVLERRGSNYPASVTGVGSIGLLYSRFKDRTPPFRHKAAELARGPVALGIDRQRNSLKSTLDLGTTTFDQASRIARYERDRRLGVDTTGSDGNLASPYITPPFATLRVSMFARDADGNVACGIEPGDRVTIDATLNPTYAGDYEVLDPKRVTPPTVSISGSGEGLASAPDPGSGEIEFGLGPYNEAVFYDDSDQTGAGWDNVPGSDPGNDTSFTSIPLDGGGNFVFLSDILDSGSQFQLPSSGYPPGNLLAWASAAGANIEFHSAHTVRLCDASSTRQLTLVYSDAIGHTWGGAVGYGALTWIGTATVTTVGGIKWVVLTLLGGEIIAFGQGILADGTTITSADLPSGFTFDPDLAMAFIHDQAESPHIMFLAGAYIDSGGVVHVDVSDDAGNTWHGNASVLIFAYQNNMGTFTTETVSGAKWAKCVLSDGQKFGVGVWKNLANGAAFGIPSDAGAASTLQAIAGSSDGQYESGSNHAQGVGGCYLDGSNNAVIFFQDGSGDTWYGTADVFGVYCESGDATPTLVTVSPLSVTLAQGAQQQFAAVVSGNSNPAVTWAVDGIAGGNTTVGLIDSTGLYSAPPATGTHTITATSVGDPTASGDAAVAINSAGSGSGGFIVIED